MSIQLNYVCYNALQVVQEAHVKPCSHYKYNYNQMNGIIEVVWLILITLRFTIVEILRKIGNGAGNSARLYYSIMIEL